MEFFKLARVKLIYLAVLAASLSGCTILDPYVDRRRNAGAPIPQLYVGRSTKEKPSICYNILTTNYETVKKMADEECLKFKTGTHAEPVDENLFTCKLLLPARINFKCVK